MQHVPSGTYYGRIKLDGKVIRCAIDAKSFTEAKLKLPDLLSDIRAEVAHESLPAPETTAPVTGREAGFESLEVGKITQLECKGWAMDLSRKVDEQYFNNILRSRSAILEAGLEESVRRGYPAGKNPAQSLSRLGVKQKEMTLPEPDEFELILSEMEDAGAPQSQDCADFARFLAFSGCRLSEARSVVWNDVDLTGGFLRVKKTLRKRKTSNAAESRLIPVIEPMRKLLERLREAHAPVAQPAVPGPDRGDKERARFSPSRIVGA
jgi:integrase